MGGESLKTALTGGFNHGGKEGLLTTASGGSNQFYAKAKGDPSAANTTDPFGLSNRGAGMSAEERAAAAEAERQKQIADTTGKISSIYDSPERQKQYGDFISAVRAKYLGDAGEQKGIADRNLKFATARSGLAGGSYNVDSKRTLGEEYSKGILAAENKAQGALSGLQSQDNTSRLNLIQLARQGLDSTTAASRAISNLQVGAQGAEADAMSQGLGDIFAKTSQSYKDLQAAQQFRRGQYSPVGSPYGTGGLKS